MARTASNRQVVASLVAALALSGMLPGDAEAQDAAASGQNSSPGRLLSSTVELSHAEAELRLEFDGGAERSFAIRDGHVWLDGRDIGPATLDGELGQSWRALLDAAMEAPTRELGTLLADWQAPGDGAGAALDSALEAAMAGRSVPVRAVGGVGVGEPMERYQERIDELEAELRDRADSLEQLHETLAEIDRDRSPWMRPFHRAWEGIADIFSIIAIYAVLVGLGFAAVFFGRRYIEGVADTARHATLRSGLVGLAGGFLVLPAFLLGIIVLTISVVGLPLLLVWAPLFPVAFILAVLFGYLGVGHAAGEALAERRFHGGDWFKRANSYYYVLTGTGLLLALFVAANVVHMAGPWLHFIEGLLTFLAVVLTWAAFTIGFGAVLLSRGGTRPPVSARPGAPDVNIGDVFEEESHV